MISEAEAFATKKHEGQMRKFEPQPYIVHPKRVAEIVRKFKQSHKINELIAAALLHDTLEDTDTNEQELERLFGKLIASLVKQLGSDKEKIKEKGKKEYLAEKMSDPEQMDSWALVIKLADRLDNVSDLDYAKPEFAKRYKEETNYILDAIEKKRKLSETQKKLIKAIRRKFI